MALIYPITTGVDLAPLPTGWQWCKLTEVARLESGHTPSRREPTYWEDGTVPWLSLKDMKNLSGKYIYQTEDMPTTKGIDNSSARILPKGTVAFCRTASVGNVVIFGVDMATSQDFANWVCGPAILPEYLYEALRASGAQFDKEKQGSTHKTIYMPVLENFRVLLPPLSEQGCIVDILDKADAIRRKRKQAIALTDQLLRSTFLEMFGDPVTNPKGWPVKSLAQIGELDRGRSRHRPRNDPRLLGGAHPLIQTGEVANCDGVIRAFEQTYSDLGLSQSKMWPAGTLCITIAANIAKTGVLAFDACFPDSVVGFTPGDEATTEYVQYWLGFLQPVLERQAPQSAQKNINLEILRTLVIPAPDLTLQRRFSAVVTKIRCSRNHMRDACDSSDSLFSSLVARAFRGELSRAEQVAGQLSMFSGETNHS